MREHYWNSGIFRVPHALGKAKISLGKDHADVTIEIRALAENLPTMRTLSRAFLSTLAEGFVEG